MSTQKQHTPGPWYIHEMDGKSAASLYSIGSQSRPGVAVAAFASIEDARLIAALPNLLAALKSVELRLTQARLASNIGRESSVKKADFLRGQCESIAHAASLTEADLGAILRAKFPDKINDHRIETVELTVNELGARVSVQAASTWAMYRPSVESAVTNLRNKILDLPTAQQKAAQLRAEADKLDPKP